MNIEDKNREIGLKIAYYRKFQHITQVELAKKVNISKSYMGKIECGLLKKGISLPVLFMICKVLKIQPGDIITLEKEAID